MEKKYLNDSGLMRFWDKIKSHTKSVSDALQGQIDDKQKQITANKSAQDAKNASLDENMTKLNTRDDQITETLKNISATGGASVASAVTYDNTTSQLTSANIQGAVDELQGTKIDKTSILQESGEAEDKVMSQKAVSAKLSDLSNTIFIYETEAFYSKKQGCTQGISTGYKDNIGLIKGEKYKISIISEEKLDGTCTIMLSTAPTSVSDRISLNTFNEQKSFIYECNQIAYQYLFIYNGCTKDIQFTIKVEHVTKVVSPVSSYQITMNNKEDIGKVKEDIGKVNNSAIFQSLKNHYILYYKGRYGKDTLSSSKQQVIFESGELYRLNFEVINVDENPIVVYITNSSTTGTDRIEIGTIQGNVSTFTIEYNCENPQYQYVWFYCSKTDKEIIMNISKMEIILRKAKNNISESTWNVLPQHTGSSERMECWKDLSLGMFIHWGLYSASSGKFTGVSINDSTELVFNINKEQYLTLQSYFTASKWNPTEIAAIAYKMGMKYIVITARHADGYYMWNSKIATPNISTSVSRTTVLDELKEACDKYGLKFCLYFNQKWQGVDNNIIGDTDESKTKWVEKMADTIVEMVKRFDPYELWFDTGNEEVVGSYMHIINDSRIANYPSVICNDRLQGKKTIDFATGENSVYHGDSKYAEDAYSLGYWGYTEANDTQEKTESPSSVMCNKILDSLSRNHNVLLNIGPKGDGSISQYRLNQLNDISKFVGKYGTFSGCRGICDLASPNWGRILVKNNVLRCFVFSGESTIRIEGVSTIFAFGVSCIDSDGVSLEIIDDKTMVVSGLPTSNEDYMPVVVDVLFTSSIFGYDCNYLNSSNNNINVRAFKLLDGTILKYLQGDAVIGNFTKGKSISTAFSWTESQKNVRFKFIVSEKSDTMKYKLILYNKNKNETTNLNIDSTLLSEEATLYQNHTYILTITCESNYCNFKGITIAG